MKIANKITLFFVIPGIIFAIVAGYIYYTACKNTLEEAIFQHLITAARSRANHVKTYLEEHKDKVELLANDSLLKNTLKSILNNRPDSLKDVKAANIDLVKDELKEARDNDEHIYEISIQDPNGRVIFSTYENSIGQDKSSDEYFLEGSKGVYIQDPYYSEMEKQSAINIAIPVLDDKNKLLLGVLVVRHVLKGFYEITTDRIGLGETGEIYLINKDSYMISPSRFKKDVILKQKVDTINAKHFFMSQGKKHIIHELEEIFVFPDYRGVMVLGTHAHIPGTQWGLLAEIDEKEALAPLGQIKVTLIIELLFTIMAILIISFLVSRMITGPITKLQKGVKIIGQGNLNYRVGTDSKDEIGDLSRAFDKMAEDLMKTTTSIDELNKEIVERKKLEAQLQQSQKMESIGTLAGGIAHDFNNILSPIMIHSEMVMMKLSPDSSIQFNLKEILKAAERATDMVKQILTFSRQKKGKRAAIKINPTLKEVLEMLRSSIPTTIDIHQDLKAESDIVLADPTQIHQILLNLATNAAHAMREKGGTLKVSLVQEDLDSEAVTEYSDLNPGSYLKLIVSDTGSGIDDETMQRIFEPYFTTKGPGEGTGMGLAVIHGIVKNYGGDITVESELGKGTTFNVYLPRIEADVSPVEEPSVQLPKGTERILFVDDEKAAVDAIQPMLENLDYKVTARTSSIEALEAFLNKPDAFDMVITDMTMPNMTGKDLAKEIMAIRSDIPVILCTGFSEQIDENKAKAMGISAFVMKPIVIRQIANTIREVLDKK